MTNAAGNYVLSGLRSGSYKLRFSDCSTPPRNLASEWWNDAATTATATSIDLTAGQVVDGINAALVTGGSIVGTVQNAGGAGIPGICVTAGSSTAGTSGSATTSANGTYSVVGLRGGADYVVSFSDCRIAREYLGEYFHNATFANSARVDVATGAPTTVDETLVKGGTVSGLVTGPGGGPVANACVSAFLGTMEATATTGSDGRYTIRALPSGTYRVRVRDCGYPTPQNLALAWFGGTNGRTAQPLDVVVESGVGGVDVALTTGGVIAGRVTAENTGAPLSQVCATAIPVHPSYYAQGFTRQAQTGADGTYAITGLSTGDYHVTFFRCFGGYDYGGEWFDDASGVNDAHAVSVVAGSTSSGVDAALSRYSMLRGRLTGAGAPLGGACVTATSTGGSFSGWAHATGDGSWSIPLPAGTYRIFYEDCDIADAHDHVAEYHSNARMESAATLVVLPAGGTVDVGLADLAVGGAVAGRLSVAAPHASLDFLDVCVSAIDPSTGAVVATTRSNTSDGTYVLRGVPVGSVKIRATDCSYFRYLVAWYGGSDETSAATLPSAAGTTTSAVDILLSRGGSLSGRVLMARDGGSAGAAPAAGVCITVNDSSGVMVSRSTTMTDGTWAAAGLPAGSYVVQFVDCSFGGLVTEWWRDASTSAAATLVVSDGSGELVVGDALLAAA
jgi:hypothetical protein